MAIIKMPEGDVSKLMFRFLEMTENGKIAGYVLGLLSLGCWFHARYQRRKFSEEMERISGQRTQLQVRVLGDRVKSSEGM